MRYIDKQPAKRPRVAYDPSEYVFQGPLLSEKRLTFVASPATWSTSLQDGVQRRKFCTHTQGCVGQVPVPERRYQARMDGR
jgi:hypothetical protein